MVKTIVARHVAALVKELQAAGLDGVPGTGFGTAQQELVETVTQWVQKHMPSAEASRQRATMIITPVERG